MKKGIRVILVVVMLISIVMMVRHIGPLQKCLRLEYDVLSEHSNWKLLDYNGIYVRAKVVAEQENEELILAIPYDKNWKVEVDGRQVAARPVEENFTGVLIKRGAHILDMKYQPRELVISVTCFLVAMFLLGYAIIKGKKMIMEDEVTNAVAEAVKKIMEEAAEAPLDEVTEEPVQVITEEPQKEATTEDVVEQLKEKLAKADEKTKQSKDKTREELQDELEKREDLWEFRA